VILMFACGGGFCVICGFWLCAVRLSCFRGRLVHVVVLRFVCCFCLRYVNSVAVSIVLFCVYDYFVGMFVGLIYAILASLGCCMLVRFVLV